jgi:hypothetical protein
MLFTELMPDFATGRVVLQIEFFGGLHMQFAQKLAYYGVTGID